MRGDLSGLSYPLEPTVNLPGKINFPGQISMAPEIPRIGIQAVPAPNVIRTLEPPIISTTEPTVLRPLRPPVVNVPRSEIPSYEPIEYQEEAEKPQSGSNGNRAEEKPVESPPISSLELPEPQMPAPPPAPTRGTEVTIPVVNIDIPVPTTKEVTLAGTTAVAATASALLGKSLVDNLLKVFKPLAKKAILTIKKLTGKKFTDYEIQDHFLFEHEPSMKKIVKVLEKERRQEMLRQALEQSEQ